MPDSRRWVWGRDRGCPTEPVSIWTASGAQLVPEIDDCLKYTAKGKTSQLSWFLYPAGGELLRNKRNFHQDRCYTSIPWGAVTPDPHNTSAFPSLLWECCKVSRVCQIHTLFRPSPEQEEISSRFSVSPSLRRLKAPTQLFQLLAGPTLPSTSSQAGLQATISNPCSWLLLHTWAV